MQPVIPYEHYSSALAALDNGGRFYNLFSKANDDTVSEAELAKVAGVFTDKQMMFLFFEMAVQSLSEQDKHALHRKLSDNLQADYASHRPQHLLPSKAEEQGEASRTAILTGCPRFVTDKTVFSCFIMVPIIVGTVTTFTMIPIMDRYDIYELRDEPHSETIFIANVRGAPRLPEELSRFGGILKETSADKEGEKEDRLFLEVAYYTPLAGSL
jgi:hypothetical protein